MIDEKRLIERIYGMSDTCNLFRWRNPKKIKDGITSIIAHEPKIGEWIPCSDRLPEEHKSIFSKFKGTDKWNSAMFENISDDVCVTVEDEKGERATMTAHTVDGKWKPDSLMKLKVIAWQPFPEPYKGNYQES